MEWIGDDNDCILTANKFDEKRIILLSAIK